MIKLLTFHPLQEIVGKEHTGSLIIQDFWIIPERHLFETIWCKRTIKTFINIVLKLIFDLCWKITIWIRKMSVCDTRVDFCEPKQ